ncbi:interferon-induced very large GTPase 1-like [Alosa pseudoharengus]|uniref:interferon-induced very large GTPase 1-like n=1 Tax=Alosa pseudoharengus TaxID=34774 RepID=UPI003F8BD110
MASKMTSPAESIGGQNGMNEESEACCLSDADKMEVDCDDGFPSTIDPQPEEPVQISSLPNDTGHEVSNISEDEDNLLAMASKMTSPAESIGGQNGMNEESEACHLSDADKMEVDCDDGFSSSIDPQPEEPAQISPLPKDTDGASRENEGKSKMTGSWPSKTDQISHSFSLALFGSTTAVKVGCGSLLSDFRGCPGLTQLNPTESKIAGRDVTVINMIGLHEVNYCQQSMDNYMGQTLGEDGIHAFLYILPPHRLTDGDKMAVEWLQRMFGPSSLHFLIIVFTYENEEDCDSIVDDLKGNTVLEQLIEKSGGRYFTSNKTLNNEMEMSLLLKKIELMIYENKTHYTAESYSEQLKKRQTISNNEDSDGPAEDVDLNISTEEDDCRDNEEKTKSQKIKKTSQPNANNGGFEKNTETDPCSGSSKTDHLAEDVDHKDSSKTEEEEHGLETAEDQSKKKEEPRRANTEVELKELFKRLNLTDRHGKLLTSDILKIDARSRQPQGPKIEGEIAHAYLNRLLMTDYRARYIPIKEEDNELSQTNFECRDNEDREVIFATLFNKIDMSNEIVEKQSQIHPMDIQMALFHSADPFLRQYLLTKLSMCQYALPLLVPNPSTSEIEFPLWAFREVWKSWKSTNASGKVSIHKEPMYGVETPMVSVFRLGHVSTSKSQLINSLINERHSTFFHKHCPGSSRTRMLMDGVVEIAWYCPSGKDTDHFPECVAICNLHGDGEASKMQQTILSEMASVNVAFLPNLCENDPRKAIVKDLFSSQTPLICLFTEDDSLLKELCKGKFKIGLRDRNQSDIVQELKKAISDSLSLTNFKLENLAQQPGIKVDEDDEDCKKGKEIALQIKGLMERNKSRVKEAFLPCQGKLWHEWCQKKKDLFRLRGQNLEVQKILIDKDMRDLRSRQRNAGSSNLMKLFLGAMDSFPLHSRMYFLKWTSILMDSCTSDELVALHHKYDEKWSKVLVLKKKHDKSNQLEKEQTELENISDQLNAATFGLEHILREMGQMYEAEIPVTCGRGDHSKLPEMAAELMISGHPLELMDGDAAHVPMTWIDAVLDEVIKKIGDKRVFVLSVLGIQSTGKSTMLNAMFGLQFAVSAGRCTRGAFMQLVSVSKEISTKFDYILVVDTEGLRALELAGKATIHHDNELATFVIGLGHMTLINIFGENPSEMQDIIQIAVQAFLRMKKVKLSPSCIFVHQNVGDITAGEKNMEGKRRLQDKLDEMTQLAAKEEDSDAKCFSDVIAFDIQKDVKYFAQLWEGSPPMAPPNPSYSENIQDLKETILTKASTSQGVKFSEFKTRVSDLWNALLNENFVFSFKNTLEIAMYRKLEAEYVKWTWSLREAMLHIENKLHNRIENDILDTIEDRFLLVEMKPKREEVEKTMAQYFDEHKDKEMLVQWRGRFERKICDVHSDLVKETQKKLNDLIQQKKTRKKLDERKVHYQNTLFKRSKELALNLKQLDKSEKALKQEFDQMWEGWLPELTSDLPRVKDCNIWEDIVSVLSENHEESVLNGRKKQGDYKTITFRGEYSMYVMPRELQSQKSEEQANKKKRYALVAFWGNVMEKLGLVKDHFKTHDLTGEDQHSIKSLIKKIQEESEEIITQYSDDAMGYNKTYIQAIVASASKSIDGYEKEVMKGRFAFKKIFAVDLLLFVCDVASNKFAELHRKFQKANDGFIYLEDQRGQFYEVFTSFCQGAKSSAVLANFICSKLKLSIRQAVYDQTAVDLAADMQCNLPALNGNRLNLERHILLSLAEEENFEKFLQYIQNPKEHFKHFITEQVEQYMKQVKSPKQLSKIKENLKHKTKCASVAAQTATEKVKKMNGDANMWLRLFSDELKDELKFAEKSCADASEITDFSFLEEVVCNGLKTIERQLSESFSKVSHLKTELFRIKPDDILIQHFCKCCWVQCPFCYAICTSTLEDHKGTDHSVPFHRSYGITGMYFRNTTNLCTDFCTTSVASNDKSFYPSHDNEVAIPFKEYKRAGPGYADWSITPDISELPYWKWFICRFKSDLEKQYNKTFEGHGEIPVQWSQYTKEQAVKSLDVYMLSNMDA